MEISIDGLYKAFDHRIRLGIMSALSVNDALDFNSLKTLLNLTDGNLGSHIKALEREQYIVAKKSFIEKMFGAMMPRGPKKMPISKMNFGGMGAKMMKSVMRKKNVDSLPDLIAQAKAAGVKFIACTMSMDVMGIHKEELIDGIEYAGVATYLAESEKAGVTLFI